eukprot:TRINITY_DN56_c0_g1_i1.p1 TRINITY_DN56_c0_g1~~TRINITY_DN56_c0_g1_i1.p1  ORF type:complete len:154 (+),score=53.54 TRINITY_DN56_c0_g1_i1:133-594(+)
MSAPAEQSYLENQVYPTLFPALEELLRWMQTHQTDQPISPLLWLAQHLKRNNPNGHLHHEGKRHYIPEEQNLKEKEERSVDETAGSAKGEKDEKDEKGFKEENVLEGEGDEKRSNGKDLVSQPEEVGSTSENETEAVDRSKEGDPIQLKEEKH